MSSIRFFLFVFAIAFSFQTTGQEKENKFPSDSSKIEIRKIDTTEIEKLKADSEMDYGQNPAAVNLWERFKRWFGNLISRILETAANANWFNILLIIIAVVGLVYVILRLLKVDALTIFYGRRGSKLEYGVLDEDIHSMDFEKLIQDALHRKEYRVAIRLLFLQSLKLLADNHHILWQPGKTNHDYVEELSANNLKIGFNELSFYFEYAWYGNFAVNENLYKKVDLLFTNWRKNI